MPLNFVLWSIPLLIIPGSRIVCRIVPLRKLRYTVYAVFLISAFTMDLFKVSFPNVLMSSGIVMTVSFILWEYFWRITRAAKGKIFGTLLILVLGGYVWFHLNWIIAGPAYGLRLWKPAVASTFKKDKVEYRVVDRDLFNRIHPARDIELSKRTGSWPLYEQIKVYRTADGYARTVFTYKWSITPLGVRLDLYDGEQRHRTMGEGF